MFDNFGWVVYDSSNSGWSVHGFKEAGTFEIIRKTSWSQFGQENND